MAKQGNGRRSRASLILEEFHPLANDGPVQDGFAFLFRIVEDPPRIQFDLMNHECTLLLARVFYEKDQFREFVDMAAQVARDAGCYMPQGDGQMLDPTVDGA